MTREKEIEKASAHRFDEWGEQAHAFELAFQAGAMWADSHLHWISVEDELPQKLEAVICTNGHDVKVGFYDCDDSGGHVMWAAPCMGCYDVTHWMPLPAPQHHFIDVKKMVSGSSEIPNNLKGGEQ